MSEAIRADAAHQVFLNTRTFGALDGFRALSVIAVIWGHSYHSPTGWRATERGFLGVDLFFIISGFLIVTLILRERSRTGGISLKNFYIRRFLRIFPLYYGIVLGLLLLFLTVAKNANTRDAFFADLPWVLTYTSNWMPMVTALGITWSLSAEEQFYVFWPPVERFFCKSVVPVLLVLLVMSQLIHFRLAEGVMSSLGFAPHEPFMLRQTGFTPIMLGVLLAHALHDPRSFAHARPLLYWRYTPLVALGVVVAICSLDIDDVTGWPRFSLHLVMTVLIGSAVIREDHVLMPALKFAPLAKVGAISYGMYLLHMSGRHIGDIIVKKLGLTVEWPLFAFTLAITIAMAWVSYTFYESRFLRLKTRFGA